MKARKTNEEVTNARANGTGAVSRRDFIAATAATGLGLGAGQPASVLAQERSASRPENSLAKADQVEMYEGTVGGAVVAQLRAAGVKMLFHTNTTGFVPVWEAIDRAGDTQVINVTHEGQAVAAAAGYAMASRKLGFFFGSGVGVGNAMSNLYNAWKDRVPLLATFANGELAAQGKDGYEDWDDHLGPTRPFTRWTGYFRTEEATDILRRAIKFAFGPPSGPVTLVWGEASQQQKIQAPIYKVDLAEECHKSRARPDLIQKAAQWLAEAENPVFILGQEIYEDGATEEIRALAEKLSVPVTETYRDYHFSNFPTDHPLYLGQLRAMRFPRSADLLMSFGESLRQGNPLRNTPTVHISHDPEMLGRSDFPELAILSNMRLAIRDLSDALDGILTKDRMRKIQSKRLADVSAFSAKMRQAREIALRGRFEMSPLSWERVGYELEKALDKDAVIVPEVGSQYYKIMGQLTFGGANKQKIGRTIGGALGWGVAAAFGINLAWPERQIVSLQGDGGFLFGQSETFWSIARYEAPMLIVIMNNHGYNETRARNLNLGGLFLEAGKDYNGYLGDPDVEFTKIAEAYRLKGEKVKSASELAPALQRCLRHMRDGKAVVLDIDIAADSPRMSQERWYQRHSIAEIRKKKLNA